MGRAFDSLYCLEGRVFVQNDCLGGRVLLPSSRVPGVCPGGGLWMKLIPALHEILFPHIIQNLIKNSTLGACFHFIGLFCYNALTVRVDKTCRKSCLEVIPKKTFFLVNMLHLFLFKNKKNRLMRHFFFKLEAFNCKISFSRITLTTVIAILLLKFEVKCCC